MGPEERKRRLVPELGGLVAALPAGLQRDRVGEHRIERRPPKLARIDGVLDGEPRYRPPDRLGELAEYRERRRRAVGGMKREDRLRSGEYLDQPRGQRRLVDVARVVAGEGPVQIHLPVALAGLEGRLVGDHKLYRSARIPVR